MGEPTQDVMITRDEFKQDMEQFKASIAEQMRLLINEGVGKPGDVKTKKVDVKKDATVKVKDDKPGAKAKVEEIKPEIKVKAKINNEEIKSKDEDKKISPKTGVKKTGAVKVKTRQKKSIDKKHASKLDALEKRMDKFEKVLRTFEKMVTNMEVKPKSKKVVNDKKTIRRKSKVAPEKMIFPTGEEYNIRNWNDIVKSTMSYLLNNGKFRLTDHLRGFVNTEPKTLAGKEYRNHWKMENYYIELHGSAQNHRDRADLILKMHKIDPKKIKYGAKSKEL